MKDYPQRYFIVAAQGMARPNQALLQSINVYCEENKAKLIIIPCLGKNAKEDLDTIDKRLAVLDVEPGYRRLNDNISIDQFNVKSQQIDPITGLNRFTQRETTKVFGNPKQRMKAIPHSNKKHPKFLVTTGCVTHPRYAIGEDVSAERRRLGNIALRDHVYGGLVVEIEDDHFFHMRQVRASKKGDFVDIGKRYYPNCIANAGLDALVLGDRHVGRTEDDVMLPTYDMIRTLKPKRIILHDYFDGHSVSHHIEKSFIQQNIIQRLDAKQDNLEDELRECYNELINLHEISNGAELILVYSNHSPDFLSRYLDEGRFMKDPQNARIGFKLASYMAERDQNNPVEAGIKMMGKLPESVKFLKVDDDYKVHGYQLACHGHLGANGGYGSITGKENDMGKSVSGHVHSHETLRNTHTVGACIPRIPYYARGQPSRATNGHGAIWENGFYEPLMIVNSKWRLI